MFISVMVYKAIKASIWQVIIMHWSSKLHPILQGRETDFSVIFADSISVGQFNFIWMCVGVCWCVCVFVCVLLCALLIGEQGRRKTLVARDTSVCLSELSQQMQNVIPLCSRKWTTDLIYNVSPTRIDLERKNKSVVVFWGGDPTCGLSTGF